MGISSIEHAGVEAAGVGAAGSAAAHVGIHEGHEQAFAEVARPLMGETPSTIPPASTTASLRKEIGESASSTDRLKLFQNFRAANPGLEPRRFAHRGPVDGVAQHPVAHHIEFQGEPAVVLHGDEIYKTSNMKFAGFNRKEYGEKPIYILTERTQASAFKGTPQFRDFEAEAAGDGPPLPPRPPAEAPASGAPGGSGPEAGSSVARSSENLGRRAVDFAIRHPVVVAGGIAGTALTIGVPAAVADKPHEANKVDSTMLIGSTSDGSTLPSGFGAGGTVPTPLINNNPLGASLVPPLQGGNIGFGTTSYPASAILDEEADRF
ncbi:hypothetical protein [Rhizosaccharibacter radicis]|uniref:Uncharacterized protein n=1 Tax=Rhizosaccharibacter radicis TaxID=2782605 RepID=A0ABT1VW56_9PROT|nr:hypothetical protein [Acetobacteraceae bacterium KSS12]